MRIRKRIYDRVMIGLVLSSLVHAAAGGGLYYFLQADQPQPVEVALDLSIVPLVPVIPARTLATPEEVRPLPRVEEPAPARGGPLVSPTRVLSPTHDGGARSAPSPDSGSPPSPGVAEALAAPQEVSPPAVPEVTTVSTAEIESRSLPATQLARHPRWIKNFITDRDYPRVAEREGRDGRVVLSVFIDETGLVKDVRLMQGSYEVLNEVALRKVREAVFTPAYNAEGRAVPSKVALPIKFELQ